MKTNSKMVRLLLVEDDPDVRASLFEILTEEGYQIFCAQDGESAVRIVGEMPIDCVLLDLMLPHLSGEEVFAWLRCHRPQTRVVIMSASGHAGDFEIPFLSKPFSIDDLLKTLDDVNRENGA